MVVAIESLKPLSDGHYIGLDSWVEEPPALYPVGRLFLFPRPVSAWAQQGSPSVSKRKRPYSRLFQPSQSFDPASGPVTFGLHKKGTGR